jgi:hypothetical protein
MELTATPAQWAELEAPRHTRRNIQLIVPTWTPEQREFYMTGYTAADWEAVFPPEDQDNPPEGWEECGCCSCYHPPEFTGDCRDDSNRWPFTPERIDPGANLETER